MPGMDEKSKQLYDNIASLIVSLHFKGSLTIEERDFLLKILDMVILKIGNDNILELLKTWQSGEYDDETDDIIKATFLSIDFTDPDSINSNSEIIMEVMKYFRNSSRQ